VTSRMVRRVVVFEPAGVTLSDVASSGHWPIGWRRLRMARLPWCSYTASVETRWALELIFKPAGHRPRESRIRLAVFTGVSLSPVRLPVGPDELPPEVN
jgi:hypothetical protein